MKLVILLFLVSLNGFAQECDGMQLLTEAIPSTQIEKEQSLLNSVVELDLIEAIKLNKLDKVKEFLDDGLDPNTIMVGQANQKSKPIIFLALERENIEIFKLLLSRGANPNLTKTADGVVDNNLLMVAFRKHALREGAGNLTSIIKILLDGEFEFEDKKHLIDFNPYAQGGMDGYRDVVSVIHKNAANAESLALLYSHSKIDPKKFIHKSNYITRSAYNGDVDFLNTYLEFNAERVSKKDAKKTLEILILKFNEQNHKTANLELIERLREIAYN